MPDNSVQCNINGFRLLLERHETDFTVQLPGPVREIASKAEALASLIPGIKCHWKWVGKSLVRFSVGNRLIRDTLMNLARQFRVAHHIYKLAHTNEEVNINSRVILVLKSEDDEQALAAIIQTYHLRHVSRMSKAWVLELTDATGRNPIKLSEELAARPEVASCSPEILVPMERSHSIDRTQVALLKQQWYLDSASIQDANLDPQAGVHIYDAWDITTGSKDIVLAVIDDGFDLNHPAFKGKLIDKTNTRDFAASDNEPLPGQRDFHGTPVASIATGSPTAGAMCGVAPDCTFLPIRIAVGFFSPSDFLEQIKFVSQHADVLNCSLGLIPATFQRLDDQFFAGIGEITARGGRRGKGLVIVFSAGNYNAPTELFAHYNKNGIEYRSGPFINPLPAGFPIFSGYPESPGVITVAAISSKLRKSYYSNWGPHITLCAPSNNYNINEVRLAGLSQLAASNREGRGSDGQAFKPALADDPKTATVFEGDYTENFGGTSGAAPIVAGIAALMLSANPDLTAAEVKEILINTADKDLDFSLDIPGDRNHQQFDGRFFNGHSYFFGAGKVNAGLAVLAARNARLAQAAAVQIQHP